VTDKILDILLEHRARATFFLIGQKTLEAPTLVQRMVTEGHAIENHTFTHPRLSKRTSQELVHELHRTQEAIREVSQITPSWFRPPYGALTLGQESLVRSQGLRLVYWTVNSKDWQQPGAEAIADKVLRQLHPGAVVVLHDVSTQTVAALPLIIAGIAARRWPMLTLAELYPPESRPETTDR
jgi:peptidoglycan-N-acetylglucosamine deacetylase